MKNTYSYKLSYFLIFFTCLVVGSVSAKPVITITITPGNCPGNGSITVTATGITGEAIYGIKKEGEAEFVQQSSNFFPNLANGKYIVAVFDASGETISAPQTLTNKPYANITTSSIVSGNAVVTGCDDDGSITLTITGGTAPYNYHLKEGPSAPPDIINTSLKKITFSQLSTGTYSIDVTDACGNIFTVPGISVKSQYNISSYDLKSFELQTPALTSIGHDLRMTFPSNNSLLIAEDGTVLFSRNYGSVPNKFIPDGYSLLMKIEYPAGSGNYLSDWHTIAPVVTDIIPDYFPTTNPQSNKYRIVVKHPCNPADIVFSPIYTFGNPYTSKNGSCSPYVERAYVSTDPKTKEVLGYYDYGPVYIKITFKSNNTITRTYTWDDDNQTYPLDITDLPGGVYSVKITTSGGYEYASNDINVGTLPTINVGYIYNYISTKGCDFFTGGIRVYGITANETVSKTYSLISGPAQRDPITGVHDMELWTDLPAGTYTMKIQYGDCGSSTKNFTLTMPYSGFESGNLSYSPATECGKFHIKGPAWYLNPNGSVATTDTYIANVFNSSGVSFSYSTATSGQEFISTILDPGTYKVTFQSSSHSQNNCSYTQAEKYITIPPYQPLAVDVPNSGGVVCQNGLGELHIATVGGSGQTISYRVKPKDSPDTSYKPFQSSPDFPGLSAGEYTVQAMDACGYTTTQDLRLVATTTSADIKVSGAEMPSGTVTEICPQSDVTLELKIIGTSQNIKWKYPNGTEVTAKTITINRFSSSDQGTYFASYTSGGCDWNSSVTLNLKPSKPDFTYDNKFILCPSNTLNLTTLTPSSGSVSGLTMSYWNSDYSQNITATANAIQDAGVYNIVGVNQYSCSDSSSVKVNVPPVTTTWIAKGNSNDWNDDKNWDNGVPANCSNVVIPAQSTFTDVTTPHYPILQQAQSGTYTQAECDTITFRFGGEVAKTNYLNYNFAKIDLTLESNRWYTLTPVLQQQYSGDYLDDLSKFRINPEYFIMYYQTGNPEKQTAKVSAKFTGFFNNTDELLKLNTGHAIWIDNGTRTETEFTVHFPKDSTRYAYYDQNNNLTRYSGNMTRDKRGRFIYEGNSSYVSNANGSFSQAIENSNTDPQLIIGNPFISHLDMIEFQDKNDDHLKTSFRIWKGSSYESYQINPDKTITTTDTGVNGYQVPPMQSFIIDTNGPFSDEILFTPAMSITQPGKTLRSSESKGLPATDVLKLEILKDGIRQSGMAIRYLFGASRHYNKGKDVWTIIPQSVDDYVSLFALVDGNAASIHTTGDVNTPIDLGIAVGISIKQNITSGKKEKYTIRIPGEEKLLAGKDVYLLDTKKNITHNLSQTAYELENSTGDISGRFQLFVKEKVPTGFNEIQAGNDIQVTYANGQVRVISSTGDPIKTITVFSTMGQLLYQIEDLNASLWSFDLSYENQVVIVKVQTETGNKAQKIRLK